MNNLSDTMLINAKNTIISIMESQYIHCVEKRHNISTLYAYMVLYNLRKYSDDNKNYGWQVSKIIIRYGLYWGSYILSVIPADKIPILAQCITYQKDCGNICFRLKTRSKLAFDTCCDDFLLKDVFNIMSMEITGVKTIMGALVITTKASIYNSYWNSTSEVIVNIERLSNNDIIPLDNIIDKYTSQGFQLYQIPIK